MIECQSNYITDLISNILLNDIKSIDVKKEIQENYFNYIQKYLNYSVFNDNKCKSYYKNENGVVLMVYPFSSIYQYFENLISNLNDYDIFK
jgi:hypothetical protein